jgi:hypothetical protein
MASDARDQKFEKALARHLRDHSLGGTCPDPEILAAYHERALSPEEMISREGHITNCSRCQEILVQLGSTEEIPVEVDPVQNLGTPTSAAAAPVHAQSIDKAKGALPQPKMTWHWLAPAGALAAGLLVWVAWHETQSLPRGGTNSVEVAENRQPATLPAVLPPEPKAAAKSGGQAREEAAGSQAYAEKDKARDSAKLQKKAGPPPKSSAALIAPALAENERTADNLDARLEKNLPVTGRNSGQLMPEPKKAETSPAGVSPPFEGTSVGNRAAAPAAAPPQQMAKQKALSEVVSSRETVEATGNSSVLQADAALKPRLISAPGGKVMWRVGSVGLIERSTNGGKNWTPQASGVATNLTAGSAPSKKVCWVVGRAGTILLTTDGGASWKQVVSPLTDDLGGVHAADARHATIWDVPNRQAYETRDGGATWSRVANP